MISSTGNQKIKNVRALISSKKERDKQGLYIIEGCRLFEEAPADRIKEVYVSEGLRINGRLSSQMQKKLENLRYEIVSDAVFDKMSDTVTPQGVMCVLEQNKHDIKGLFADTLKSNGGTIHITVLEGIQDPGNLGTIIRSSEAAGFDFIIADSSTADVYSPKVIRSAMGSAFRIPVVYTDKLTETVDFLKLNGITVYASHLNAVRSYRDIKYSEKCAFLIGNEGNGLSEEITRQADELVKIPMHGNTESLNAAVAASILMFEVNV